MPSRLHEGLVEVFREHPEAAAGLLRDALNMKLPSYEQVRLDSIDLTELDPAERRADAIVTFTTVDTDQRDQPVLAVIVEVQLGCDDDKRWRWPSYLTSLRNRLRCPVMLLVVCPTRRAARWSATPIDLGHPGLVLRPLVLGPAQVPVVTDTNQADGLPELAMLSAVVHSGHPDHLKTLEALADLLESIDRDRAVKYSEVMLAVLPAIDRRRWEALMATQAFKFESDYAQRLRAEGRAQGEAHGRAQGEAHGRASMVLAVLNARGFEVSDDIRAQIITCSDLGRLDAWGCRAVTAATISDVFA